MDNNDELLIRNFLTENRHDISDDGFTQRVMQNLPQTDERRVRRIMLGVQAALYAAIAVIFVLLGGLDTLRGLTEGALADILSAAITDGVSLTPFFIAAAACILLLYYRIYELASGN